MQRLKSLLLASGSTMLLAVSIPGCAQKRDIKNGLAQNSDCRSCHTANGAAGARDFSHIYANPSSHHAVGTRYPSGLNAKPNFKQPNGQSAGIAFFDRNGNGLPDNDEIQLPSEGGVATVECASCHKKHGNTPAPAEATRNHYLRFDNTGSALCINCHIY